MDLRQASVSLIAMIWLAFICSAPVQALASQGTNDLPTPLSEAAKHVILPPGFKASIFAGEPDIRQPVAMTFDDRGRLWVAECYTYADLKTNYDLNLRDRIVIFEDSKGTGHFDKRTVFWDQGKRLTSIAVGFGGVFATCAPNLVFIPDRNGDDIPDGPPETLLDGWDTDVVRHNIVNGLKWGPDGWLYGRHGILATSSVGKPGAAENERTKLNCGIWRYHPTRKVFEVVCQGTTNPWGHDWDEYGNLMFINTVIGHLWQGIPGAYYERMFGEHLAPYRYGLIGQAADHYHWDTGKSWTESRNSGAGSDALGGGHAHSGLMIYLGNNWPEQCRGKMFTLNFHGRRINEDRLEQNGSGLVGRHEPDFIKFGDAWFRGVDLDYGPDGGVYVLDWSDTGECHGHDGVNRESGRIYKLTHESGDPKPANSSPSPSPASLLHSLALSSDAELVKLQHHPNEWYARHARRILQERSASGKDLSAARQEILRDFDATTNVPVKIRLLFALHAIGADSQAWLTAELLNPEFHIRGWAVRFLAESGASWQQLVPLFTKQGVEDPSPVVRLELASALQRIPVELRESLASVLVRHGEDATDHNLPLMLWYGIEPIAAEYPDSAIRLARQSRMPVVREYIARRLGEELSRHPQPVEDLLQTLFGAPIALQMDVLRGLTEALQDWHHAPKPRNWDSLRQVLASSQNAQLLSLARRLGVLFGDATALTELRLTALNPSAAPEARRSALEQLATARPADLKNTLVTLLQEPVTSGTAARVLLEINGEAPGVSAQVLRQWPDILPEDRPGVVSAMASRPSSAGALLEAVARGTIPRGSITAYHARQIANLKDPALDERLARVWGKIKNSDSEKKHLMERYRGLLNPDRLKTADAGQGRVIFTQVCAVCHKLYGQGAAIGPDLTGGGRANLEYLLENIIDPSAIVPEDYRVSEVELKDYRSITGLIAGKNEQTIALQTPTGKITVERSEIAKMRQTNLSLMPEGLLQAMKDDQVCDLIKYLMTPSQVPLPQASAK